MILLNIIKRYLCFLFFYWLRFFFFHLIWFINCLFLNIIKRLEFVSCSSCCLRFANLFFIVPLDILMSNKLSVVAQLVKLIEVGVPLSNFEYLFLYRSFNTRGFNHLAFYIYIDLKLRVLSSKTLWDFILLVIFVNSGNLL